MSVTYQNGKKNCDVERKYQGCLGKMVNLFELHIGAPANKRLTDKPHRDGFTSSRTRSSDVSHMAICGDQIGEKTTVSALADPFKDRKSNKPPMKMLIDQEMSKEVKSSRGPPNLVAKLMGLDALPQEETDPLRQRVHTRSHSDVPVSDYERDSGLFQYVNPDEYKTMALVRQTFMEAKRLSMDENHRHSKKLQDALDLLNANKDLFLKCLQEPNPVFSHNLGDLQPMIPSPIETKRITILRPSKLAGDNKDGKQNKNGAHVQPTRIVVLKPKCHVANVMDSFQLDSRRMLGEEFLGDVEDDESHEVRQVANAITIQMREKLGRYNKDDTLNSSVFSNGYVGDDSSFNKSEIDYPINNLSDSDVMSPVSRHSWDCINRYGSTYSPSALSRASYSSESSVSREAKKRLSERWALMASNGNPLEHRHYQSSASTLGEMLSLSEVKKGTKSGGRCNSNEQHKDSNLMLHNGRRVDDNVDSSPRNLIRSKSLPLSSELKEDTNAKSAKSSFRGKVSSLLFSRNKKGIKDKSLGSNMKDEVQPVSGEIPGDSIGILCNKLHDHVSSSLSNQTHKNDLACPEVCFSTSKPITSGNLGDNQDQPSPISVLDAPFEEDDHTSKDSSHFGQSERRGFVLPLNHLSSKSINKSPPIGSIARTLSWDDLCTDTSTSYPLKESFTIQESQEEEKQKWFFYLETLLSEVALKGDFQSDSWHSPNSPLDPSLRDAYIDLKDYKNLTEAKRRQIRSIQKLLFDYVNTSLVGTANRFPTPCIEANGSDLFEKVRSQVNAWFSGEIIRIPEYFEEDNIMLVERVVKEEFMRKCWTDESRLEKGNLGKEIEGKLLEELVHETVLDLTGHYYSFCHNL